MTPARHDPMRWAISAAAHDRFTAVSGDHNPIHADPVAARRLPFGRQAVHGVHLVMAGVDRALGDAPPGSITHLRAAFRHSVAPGDPLCLSVESGDQQITATIDVDVWRAVELSIRTSPEAPVTTTTGVAAPDPERVASDLSAPDLERRVGDRGSVRIEGDVTASTSAFPTLAERLGPQTLAELASISRLVGMHVPGLHSLLSAIELEIGPTGADTDQLSWTLRLFDERFARAVLDVESPNVRGVVTAFVRPAPVEPDLGAVGPPPDAFAGQRWLVAGGSRGLGAITTLLLDAGGAEVRFTHRAGNDDAARLAARTSRATAHHLDVDDLAPGLAALRSDGWHPTHLAWFVSPPIFDGAAGTWSDRLVDRFREVYVERFAEALGLVGSRGLDGVLWPSSTAVASEVLGLAEYATAKREGEAWCSEFAKRHPESTVVTPRFPRLATDQTASVLPVENLPPAPAVLAALEPFTTPS